LVFFVCSWRLKKNEKLEFYFHVDLKVLPHRPAGGGGGGGGGTARKKWGGVGPTFQNPYRLYDQNLQFSLPCL